MTRNIFLESCNDLGHHIGENFSNNSLIIVDEALDKLNLHTLSDLQTKYFKVSEDTKNLNAIEAIWDIMFSSNLNRSSEVIIIGGGVLLDLAAFAASTFKRGISFTLIPSTLLAMVDASHGGKNGFNNNYGKNQIGTFNLPNNVIICSELLSTLDDRDYKDGLVELIKHGLIGSKEIFNQLVISDDIKVDFETIKKGIQIKTDIVEEDFLENGKRKYLNFGHTIGHLIEHDSNFNLSHGQAVAIGINYELELSKRHFGLSQEVVDNYNLFLKKINFSNSYEFINNINDLIKILEDDKKSTEDSIDIVLLSDISEPNLINLSFGEILEVVQN
jgi:3-dehydroquinate synthase|tara:strand:- start:1544 stop:2536 length:993 start_codon:yes stop_codon:yes gene_type:complete